MLGETLKPVALVTGADRGLGRALTAALLASDWTVVAGRHLDWPELDELAAKYPDSLHIVPLDVGSDPSVKAAAEEASRQVAHIDLLIANAGIIRSDRVNSIRDRQDYGAMMDEFNVNALGALRVIEAFMPMLDAGKLKRLCLVSSEAGSIAASSRGGWFGYCMSKCALNMAAKNLHNDLAPQGYTLRLYYPGWMRTFMHGAKNLDAPMEPEEAAEIALRYFLGSTDEENLTLHAWDGSDFPW